MIIQVYVDEKIAVRLSRISAKTGRSVEDLASAAVENAVIEADPAPISMPGVSLLR